MLSWARDRSSARFDVFRIAVTCIGVLAALVVVSDWLNLHHAHNLSPMEPSVSPLWIVGLVALCAFQVVLLWWRRISLAWWEPLLIEAGLFVAFAICRHQVTGSHLIACSGLQGCTTIQDGIIHRTWWGAFAAVGAALGVVWSLTSRS